MYALFTMGEVEDYFAVADGHAQFAGERLEELRKKRGGSRQGRNAAALTAGGPSAGTTKKIASRALNRRANVAAGLGASGQRRGYFRTIKGKQSFVRGGAVLTKRSSKGLISKSVIDPGARGLRGALRGAYRSGTKLAGKNKVAQRALETGYRGASRVLARPGKAGIAGAGLIAGGAAANYLVNRNNGDR